MQRSTPRGGPKEMRGRARVLETHVFGAGSRVLADGEEQLRSLPGARRASSWPKNARMAPFASACTSCTACTYQTRGQSHGVDSEVKALLGNTRRGHMRLQECLAL